MAGMAGYHHLSLSVTDLDRSAAWYGEVLGFTKMGELEKPGFARALLVQPESGMRLALTSHEAGSGDSFSELRTGMDHVAFLVADVEELEAWKRRFEALGVDHSDIKPAAAGAGALITLRDPDNVQLEVFAEAR